MHEKEEEEENVEEEVRNTPDWQLDCFPFTIVTWRKKIITLALGSINMLYT